MYLELSSSLNSLRVGPEYVLLEKYARVVV